MAHTPGATGSRAIAAAAIPTSADRSLATFRLQRSQGYDGYWRNKAMFELHQATEQLYHCALLTLTLYSPKSHNLEFLRNKSEDLARDLIEVWPRDGKFVRRCFELLLRPAVRHFIPCERMNSSGCPSALNSCNRSSRQSAKRTSRSWAASPRRLPSPRYRASAVARRRSRRRFPAAAFPCRRRA